MIPDSVSVVAVLALFGTNEKIALLIPVLYHSMTNVFVELLLLMLEMDSWLGPDQILPKPNNMSTTSFELVEAPKPLAVLKGQVSPIERLVLIPYVVTELLIVSGRLTELVVFVPSITRISLKKFS